MPDSLKAHKEIYFVCNQKSKTEINLTTSMHTTAVIYYSYFSKGTPAAIWRRDVLGRTSLATR
jgi:hypothetical protein